jgi:hypothetical protein
MEWHRFFDGLPSSGPETQRARMFDTRIAASFTFWHLGRRDAPLGRSAWWFSGLPVLLVPAG